MSRKNGLRRTLSALCVLCLMLSLLISGTPVSAAGDPPPESSAAEPAEIPEALPEQTPPAASSAQEAPAADPIDDESASHGALPAEPAAGEGADGAGEDEEAGDPDAGADTGDITEAEDETEAPPPREAAGDPDAGAADPDTSPVETEPGRVSGDDPVRESEPAAEAAEPLQRDGEARSSTSANLADFLTNVVISAPTDENGSYIIDPNNSYEMTFSFAENEGLQFDDEAVLIYNLPEGLLVSDIGAAAFSINVVDENGTATVSDNTFAVVNGQLQVRFNQSDPNFDRLKATSNARFNISIASRFDQTAGEIVFAPNIVKDFVFEENADLTIAKRVTYDMDTDTAHYVVQVTSAGINENVVVEDRLTGTALLFNRDVTVESSVSGTLSVTPDYTSVENGYRVAIPQMANGEVLTFRYSAAVDNTKISSNGTVEQTNNTVRVISDQVPDGKEASADFHGQADFQRVAKSAAGEPVQLGENLYEQTWTIRVNEDHKLPMGGADISDWITQNSRPFMSFNGDGLTVSVTFENGQTETRVVPWSELYLWQNGDGIWGWRYTPPESDGKASYEITCTTQINSSGALGDLTLVNGAQVYGSYDEGQTTVGVIGESEFGVKKDAVGTSSTESEWAITVTVPGSGLSEMHVTDDAPKLTYEGQEYIDYFIENSFEVEGLLEGESWDLYIGSSQRSYTITFYKTEAQSAGSKGLLPTPDGQPRDIVIRFKTQVNQDWLALAANDGYASSSLYRHRNYAAAWSGSYRTETVNATVIPIKPELVKDFVERSEAEVDGVTYPVFRYSLTLLGPTEDGIVIPDSFNTDYLKLYEAEGVRIRGWSNSAPANENGTASAVDTASGADITVSSFPKQSDGSFYPYYLVSYSLIVKDEAALSALNEAAAASQTGVDLENTAIWDSTESSSAAPYTYFPYVDKELLTRPSADNGYVAEFKLIINKYAEDLDPTTDTLTILDELSANLRFIPDSLTITPANGSIGVQHEAETNTIILTDVPDETTFEITYQARVLGNGNVTYSNTVKFGKYEKTVEETTTVESSGGGTASNPSITLVKRDAENLSATLAGASFQLFYMNEGTMVPVQDKDGQAVIFTTAADGTVLIAGNQQQLGWTLWEGRTYCLVETTAPVGYELNPDPTYFVLSETPSSQMEYDLTGDQFSIQNTPQKLDIVGAKTWDDNDDQDGVRPESITIRLLADGVEIDSRTVTEADDWSWSFKSLPKFNSGTEIAYSITEDAVSDYSTAYDGFDVTNTHEPEKTSLSVTKEWDDQNNKDGNRPQSVTIRLLADGEDTGKTLVLNAGNQWTGQFADLERNRDGRQIAYSVSEEAVSGYTSAIQGDMETGFTITNTQTPKETPTDTPEETPTDTPEETPTDTPEETPTDTPKETPTDTPKETPKDTPKDAPKETPKGAPRTGDESPFPFYLWMLLLSGGAAAGLLRKWTKRKKT